MHVSVNAQGAAGAGVGYQSGLSMISPSLHHIAALAYSNSLHAPSVQHECSVCVQK